MRGGVPYEYRLTFKGWVVALLILIEEKLHITIFKEKEDNDESN